MNWPRPSTISSTTQLSTIPNWQHGVWTDYSLQTTARQVRTIRSLNRWLRASTGPSKAAQRVTTQKHVERAILNGPARSFGRRWFTSYLPQEFGYRARRDDVAIAQQQLDPEGVAQRLPGPVNQGKKTTSHQGRASFGALTAMTSSRSMDSRSILLSMHTLARSFGSTAVTNKRSSQLMHCRLQRLPNYWNNALVQPQPIPIRYNPACCKRFPDTTRAYDTQYNHRTVLQLVPICDSISSQSMESLSKELRANSGRNSPSTTATIHPSRVFRSNRRDRYSGLPKTPRSGSDWWGFSHLNCRTKPSVPCCWVAWIPYFLSSI